MDWGRSPLGLLCCLALACGPDGVAAPDTEGDSEDTGTGSTGDGTNPTATNPTATSPTATNASNSGTATTTAGTTPPPPPEDSSGDDPPDTMPPETETGECPYGTEGCLCDVGAACDEGLFCDDDGMCVGMPDCRVIDVDPHGTEDSAAELDMLGCGDDMDLGVFGTIAGPEVDWYRYVGGEAFSCVEQPAVAVSATVDLEVCVFIECLEGNAANVSCAEGSTEADSPEGRPGCCGQNIAGIQNYACMGQFAGKDVDVYAAVGSDQTVCEDYSMSYAF